MESIRELLVEELRDLYDAEKQLVKALPKMVKAASNEELGQAFEEHLEQTRGQVERLERAFELLDEKAKAKPCAAMKGLLTEAQEQLEEDMTEPLMDSAIICAAQKVEHYEIAGYGTVCAWARSLGLDEVADLLEQTLNEEKAADEKLSTIASAVFAEAEEGMSDEEDDEELEMDDEMEEEPVSAGKKASGKAGTMNKPRSRAV
ncbi:MAG TPA: ferritin-like domain-containing protein [Bryobacteraceae bacterium]|nr:ferritin-like domain-containing protein [Bryobacteraceae bacterium]